MTPEQLTAQDEIAAQLDAAHAAKFAPVSVFDAPTFAPADLARLCGVADNTVTEHVRKVHNFPAPIEPQSWFLKWKRAQWPVVLLTFLRACPKARRNLAHYLGLSVTATTAEQLVREVLENPFKTPLAPA